MSVSNNKDRIWIVDSNLVGPKRRRINPDGFHPMMRESWNSIEDRLRAVLAKYYTVYNGSKGATLGNMANPNTAYDGGSNGVGRLSQQSNLPVLRLLYDEEEFSPQLNIQSDEFTNIFWNEYTNRSPESESYIYNNLVNFSEYVQSVIGPSLDQFFEDYTSAHYMLSQNNEIREAGNVECSIQSIYQFMVSSAPPYEEVISAPALPEHILPSAYIMQGEAFNTSSSPLTNYSIQAISMDGKIPWFDSNTAAETSEGVYYELFAGASQNIISEGDVGTVSENLSRLSNMVILNSDLELATEQGVFTTTIPFYTKITIGRDPDNTNSVETSGKSLGTQIYEQIAADPTTQDFIDYIQIEAVRQYLAGTQDNDSFRTTVQTRKSPNNAADFEFATSVEEYPVLFKTSNLQPTLDITNIDNINNVSEDSNFILLRDFNRQNNFQLNSTHINNATTATSLEMQNVGRKFSEVLEGTKCHTEVLMYVIEKRRIIDITPGPIVQRFFISRKFNPDDTRPVVFYDTQVKYGQRYVYNIKKIVTVFGNYYRYLGLWVPDVSGEPPAPEDLRAPSLPGFGAKEEVQQVIMDDIFSEGAEEQEEMQNLMDDQITLAEEIGEQIVNETLQNLSGQFGLSPGTVGGTIGFGSFGTGPVSRGPGSFGLGPGSFGGVNPPQTPPGGGLSNMESAETTAPPNRRGPSTENITVEQQGFNLVEDIEEPEF